ncbi:hypothetical protein F0562_015596 [Nyssa sinensis]|uniref:Uncharacterized protein n=1 Tax=Nyssa sinensis TaxID=561372 RepID=A0A5J4ZKT6_9ASTE|nr:hypothetical protein F0562_015596 [Nyssa sinensis]
MLLVFKPKAVTDMLKQDRDITTRQIATFGFFLAPLWFITEYLANAALARTSIARQQYSSQLQDLSLFSSVHS